MDDELRVWAAVMAAFVRAADDLGPAVQCRLTTLGQFLCKWQHEARAAAAAQSPETPIGHVPHGIVYLAIQV